MYLCDTIFCYYYAIIYTICIKYIQNVNNKTYFCLNVASRTGCHINGGKCRRAALKKNRGGFDYPITLRFVNTI